MSSCVHVCPRLAYHAIYISLFTEHFWGVAHSQLCVRHGNFLSDLTTQSDKGRAPTFRKNDEKMSPFPGQRTDISR